MLRTRLPWRRFSTSSTLWSKTPFQVFTETFRSELKKSKELQTNIKALQDETGRLSESSAFKRAREALEKSREARSATSRTLQRAGAAVGTAAQATWDSAPVRLTRNVASTAADGVDKLSAPIRESAAFKTVKNVVDDGASLRYGGFETREQRLARRQQELLRQAQEAKGTAAASKRAKINENAGQSVVVHETAKPDKPESALQKSLQSLRTRYEESDNALVATIRSVTDAVGSFFGETEQAQVIRAFREIDPQFSQEMFLRELRAYIVPELVEAYVRGEAPVLQKWLSESSFNVWKQLTKEYREKNLYAAGQVLEIRNVDIAQAKMRQPDNTPMYIISCRAQETSCYRSIKTDEVVAGIPDQILLTPYVLAVARDVEQLDNPETRGWKVLEFVRGKPTEYL